MVNFEQFSDSDDENLNIINLPRPSIDFKKFPFVSKYSKQNQIWSEVKKFYKLKGKIGNSRFSTVYRAKCRTTGEQVAIKHVTQ